MDSNKKSFLNRVKKQGLQYGMQLMNDPKNQSRIIELFNTIEKGRNQISHTSKQVLGFFNLPTKQDLSQINQKISYIKKQLQEVQRSLNEQADTEKHQSSSKKTLN